MFEKWLKQIITDLSDEYAPAEDELRALFIRIIRVMREQW